MDDLDLATLEKMSAEHVDEQLLKRLSDMIWRVRFRGGTLADGSRPYVLLLQGFQSTVDRGMTVRLPARPHPRRQTRFPWDAGSG